MAVLGHGDFGPATRHICYPRRGGVVVSHSMRIGAKSSFVGCGWMATPGLWWWRQVRKKILWLVEVRASSVTRMGGGRGRTRDNSGPRDHPAGGSPPLRLTTHV
jgi:hypothetical protein